MKRRGNVRAGKLYYLRDLEGKAARIKEDLAARQGQGREAGRRRRFCRISSGSNDGTATATFGWPFAFWRTIQR